MPDVGDQYEVEHFVYDPAADPPALIDATVALTVTAPDASTSSPSIAHPGVGHYRALFTLSQAGTWYWHWAVSGAVVEVEDGQVTATPVEPEAYATLEQFKLFRGRTDTAADAALRRALLSGARHVDQLTGREPGGFWLDATPTVRVYQLIERTYCTPDGEWLIVDEIGSTAGLVVEVGDGVTWTAVTGVQFGPPNALVRLRPVTRLLRPLSTWYAATGSGGQARVTARHGWPALPPQVTDANLIQANRIYLRKDSPEGVAGSSEWGVMRLARTDPDVAALLAPFELAGLA